MKHLTKNNLRGFFDDIQLEEEFTYSSEFSVDEIMDFAIGLKYKIRYEKDKESFSFMGQLSEQEDYYFNVHKKVIKEVEDKIVDFVKKGTKNLFAYEICPIEIRVDSNVQVGFTSFELFMIDESGDSVFGCTVEAKLNSNDQRFKIPNVPDSEIDYSLKSVRISSNPRSVGNKFETSQALIAALLMSSSDFLPVLFNTMGELILNSHRTLDSL